MEHLDNVKCDEPDCAANFKQVAGVEVGHISNTHISISALAVIMLSSRVHLSPV